MKKQPTKNDTFSYDQFANAFRKEIEEYGALLNLIYEQQNCLMKHNPISLLQATSKIEAQLPANHSATANRSAFVQQLAEENGKEALMLNEIPKYVPENLKTLFEALVEEVIALRYRIKAKTQMQQKLLGQAQFINSSVLQQILPNAQTRNKTGKQIVPSKLKGLL
ncbi:MAG: hypothetical protein LBJ78_02610 [Puniceicoccales bacterium]|jgi:hypothetical protein|nr:hypothetical protein [Puniceicoccales bacterium]